MPHRISILFVALTVLPGIAQSDPPIVHVSGHGALRVTPDQVIINLTVTTTDDDLIRVRKSSDEDARTILELAKKQGIGQDAHDVSRLELSLDFNEQLRRQIYQVERDITLRLGDLKKLDALLSDLLEQRSLKVSGIQFVASNMKKHETAARSMAVADAKEKARQLAELNSLKLGNAREIDIVNEFQRPFVTSIIPVVGAPKDPFAATRRVASDVERVQFVAMQGAIQEAKQAAADGEPFALGKIEVTADVNISFDLVGLEAGENSK